MMMFHKMFKICRQSFEKLFTIFEPLLYTSDAEMAIRSSGSYVTRKAKLYCTLRYLTDGSYLDICIAYVFLVHSFSTNYKSGFVWPVIDVINIAFIIGIHNWTSTWRSTAIEADS